MFQFKRLKDQVQISGINRVSGQINIDSDKSISHRAIIFSSLANGKGIIKNCLYSDDVKSTIHCLRMLGINIYRDGKKLIVNGKGKHGFKKPDRVLDAGNSGTTMRLLSGVLAGQRFNSSVKGDASLSRRPMARITVPLCSMGAVVNGRIEKGNVYPPLIIKGKFPLKGIYWKSKIASAQVKSAILLAGLFCKGLVIYDEPFKSRDHTERMMIYFGIPVKIENTRIILEESKKFNAKRITVPGDISSAAYYLALSILLENSSVAIKNVGLNPTRIGFLKVLEKMGAKIKYGVTKSVNNEPVGFIEAKSSNLKAINIGADIIPEIVDEIPLIALLATQAQGKTLIAGAGELRVKESDRLRSITVELKKMGANIQEMSDGLIINGPTKLIASNFESYDDHRIAMTLAIGSLVLPGNSTINGFSAVKISSPNFWQILQKLCASADA
ncbi:MAG: 3-phosphoshikimate 1-carboxyvinyltransferase [bacterium]